jgi:hypothetical protein
VWRGAWSRTRPATDVQDTWRSNTTELQVHLGVQEQSALDWTPRPYTESDFDVPHWLERYFHRASNHTGPMTK